MFTIQVIIALLLATTLSFEIYRRVTFANRMLNNYVDYCGEFNRTKRNLMNQWFRWFMEGVNLYDK